MSLKKEIKVIEKQIKNIETNIKEDINGIEKWIIERRRFLIKLGIVAGMIAILLILSRLYLRTTGYGV